MTATIREGTLETPDLRHVLGAFATGVTVVTTLSEQGEPHGMTATSFCALSLDPPLIQWSLRNSAWSCPIFVGARHFAINILGESQEDLSRLFASPVRDRFSKLDWARGLHNLPLLAGSAAWFECALEETMAGGDHTILVGRVLRARRFEAMPLLHWSGRYAALSEAPRPQELPAHAHASPPAHA